jgi:Uma2 family endonuclease
MSVLMAEKTGEASTASAESFFGLPVTHSWTLDDLARLPDDGRRYEIVDGSLHVAPAPAVLHQLHCGWLHEALLANKPADVYVFEGANVMLPAEPTRLLVPDVLVVRVTDIDIDDNPFAVPASAVPLAVEVVSPSSITHDRFTKPALYAEAGVPSYWRVETGRDGPTVHVYALAAGAAGAAGAVGAAEYTRTHLVRPGQTVVVDAPWPVTLTPPERAASRA